MTLAEALHESHTRWPERVAIKYQGSVTTYRELCSAVAVLADAYDRHGIQPGDRVICALGNRPEYVIVMMATWMHGAVHVGVDADLPHTELRRVAHFTDAKALVHSKIPSLSGSTASDGHGGPIVTLLDGNGESLDHWALRDWLDRSGHQHSDLPRCSPRAPAGALATLFLTHGTTGQPKFPVSYQRTLVERWGYLAGLLEYGPDDVHLAHLPLSHGFGLMMSVTALLTGGCLVFPSSSSIEEALGLIAAERVSVVSGSPVLYRLMIDRRERLDLRSIRIAIGSAAPFTLSLLRELIEDLGLRFMLMYGASEGVGVVTIDPDDILRGSVGRPQPGTVAIVGPDRQPVPTGIIGEIAFSRSMFPVSYWDGRSAAPPGANGEGVWYYSGDLGRFDEAGRLYVAGRLAHQINRAGLKIDPLVIEAAILNTGRASDVAVVGLPDPVLGEIACAYVVPRAGHASMPANLRDDLMRALGPSRCPDRIVTLESIPRTRVGKVNFADLKAKILVEQPE
jgi:acyl-CoA synthetase (AMP-forming)/AMP-acid ligase II